MNWPIGYKSGLTGRSQKVSFEGESIQIEVLWPVLSWIRSLSCPLVYIYLYEDVGGTMSKFADDSRIADRVYSEEGCLRLQRKVGRE